MDRRGFMAAAGGGFAAGGFGIPGRAGTREATFLVAHGAWSAGWAWKKMHPLMTAAGHRLITPTYTGLGEREHLANPSIDLETHIQDMLGVIKYEQLDNLVLIGHSITRSIPVIRPTSPHLMHCLRCCLRRPDQHYLTPGGQ